MGTLWQHLAPNSRKEGLIFTGKKSSHFQANVVLNGVMVRSIVYMVAFAYFSGAKLCLKIKMDKYVYSQTSTNKRTESSTELLT